MQTMTVLMQPLAEPITVRPLVIAADYEAAWAQLDQMIGKVEPVRQQADTMSCCKCKLGLYTG